MKKIAIIGAGGFGREVHMLIEQINNIENKYDFIGYFDDGIEKGTLINGYPILGRISEINNIDFNLEVVSAIGEPAIKEKLIDSIENSFISFPILIHPNACIGNNKFVQIGEGCIITAGVIITVNINIGRHVILNLATTIGHDTNIGDYSSFMPNTNISGEVIINKCVYVGTGAKVINQLEIGEYSIIGAGAVVAKSLPANCTAVGIPAKVIKQF